MGRSNNKNNVHSIQKKKRRSKRDRLPFSRRQKGSGDGNTIANNTIGNDTIYSDDKLKGKGMLIVHNAACNHGKTNDGVIKGGERLANEMLDVIRDELRGCNNSQKEGTQDVTISIIGNSLGGLYGRYAVAHLAEVCKPIQLPDKEEDVETRTSYLMDDDVHIHLNVFCSTASPHLGCASHTYVKIPRTAELGVAKFLGETGSDLFRTNDLLLEMATSNRFLQPLASFRRRIAYANAYRTDFPVPGSTAAFLDANSNYPHRFEESTETCSLTERGLIAATLHTPRLPLEDRDTQQSTTTNINDLTAMSLALDSLGWKKVVIDMRNKFFPVPSLLKSDNNTEECPMRQLRRSSNGNAVKSSDIERAISTGNVVRDIPLGHNAIAAINRGTTSTAVNSVGRHVIDRLSIELCNEIATWDVNN